MLGVPLFDQDLKLVSDLDLMMLLREIISAEKHEAGLTPH